METHPDTRRPGLEPPRFSLATLMLVVGLLAVLFATTTYIGLYATLILLFFLLTVAAHVAGNAIGTKLRSAGSRRHPRDADAALETRNSIDSNKLAPRSQLHHRSALGLPIIITTALGTIAGAALGGYGLTNLMRHPTPVTIAFAVIASAVLGGIWTFAASSFLQVTSSALRQAARDSKR